MMLRKLALGLVAASSLGIAALAPTTASAFYWGWHGHPHFHRVGPPVGFYLGGGPAPRCVVKRWVPTPRGPRLRWVNICY